MSWVGFGGTDREGALKLLTISAAASGDVHSSFAALTLLTWYGLILLRTFYSCTRIMTSSELMTHRTQ